MATKLNFDAACSEFLKDVRNDATATSWAALTYADGSNDSVVTLGRGDGTADELASKLADDQIVFALVRTTEQIDNSKTVKFAFIHFVGQSAKRMLVARQSVHSGSVKEFFAPYHVTIEASAKSDVSAAIVDEQVGITSGQRSRVLDKTQPSESVVKQPAPAAAKPVDAPPKAAVADKPKVVVQPKAASASAAAAAASGARAALGIAVDDEDAVRQAIASVRAADANNWALVSYVDGAKPDRLTLVGSGKGGVDEMLAKITPNNVYYALTRHIERIDQTEAVKFGHVQFSGPQAPRMLKARIGTHKGAVEALFRPYHVDIVTEDIGDVTEANLLDRIASASGTKSHVK